jgi:uncharacterized phiE125 gp8 family phage protein
MSGVPGALVVTVAEVKAFLRLEHGEDDAMLAGLVRTAMALCEAFTGQWLIIRAGEQRLTATTDWQRLAMAPAVAIVGVERADGPLAAADFDAEIDASGTGWVRLKAPIAGASATARAGLGDDWNGIPEPLRQGIIRLVAHLYAHRDAADAGPPPTAVAAMWRPWRRLRLN